MSQIFAQEPVAGNVIKDFGRTYKVEDPDFKTDTTQIFKAVFDIAKTSEDPSKPNPLLETAARFLNMHQMAGVPSKNIIVALVIHGSASQDILNDQVYSERVSVATNPNTLLLTELANHGVEIILCGQTAAHRKITINEAHPNTKIALSAMTALVQLQNQGYQLINF
tara:strand:- start:39973 stop:40473 length:501 start_codon:yes stop_codon:yes gene_type:complete